MTDNRTAQSSDSPVFFISAGLFAVYVFFRLFGSSVFDNHWSFSHWDNVAGWYPWVWGLVSVLLIYFLRRHLLRLASLFESMRIVRAGITLLLVVFIFFHLDSFLLGGGNVRVAQISQSETVILRWFEFGSVGIVAMLYKLLSLFGISGDSGGVIAWRVAAFLSAAFSVAGVAKLSAILSDERPRQILLFLIGLFGAQTMLYLGFVGVESFVVPVTIWFVYFAIRAVRSGARGYLAMVWLVTIVGVVLHLSLAYLLPSTVFLSAALIIRSRYSRAVSSVLSVLTIAGLLHLIYRVGINSPEFSEQVLRLEGKLPFSDYGIASSRHIADMIGLVFLVAPTVLLLKSLVFVKPKWSGGFNERMALWLMALCGTMVVTIVDPINSIVLDVPRLAAYLTPYSLLLMVALSDRKASRPSRSLLAFVAAMSIAVSLSYLPVYRYIKLSEGHAVAYTEQFPSYWRTTAVSLRDAYFYNRQMDKANEWDVALPVKSTDYLAMRGSNDLIVAGNYQDAIAVLYRLVATNPYWDEPRAMLAATQLRLGQNELAKPHIDTALMLRPFVIRHHLNLYSYYRNTKQIGKAIDVLNRARRTFPDNLQLIASLMAARYMNREVDVADSLALFLMAADSTLPDAYMIKGLIEDGRGNLESAADFYRKFVLMAPYDPDQPAAQKRLNEIVLQLKKTD